ncbi:ATP-binding protein [Streptomyces niveus]|uniref:ATP-binding protein n=2 Tax=Streptomyces niveus TaxID=193462 RepID=A0ABZ2A4U7_STRNV|nr:ATP-binding protein [Streptomyces niveus]
MNEKPPLPVRPIRDTQPPAPTHHFTMRFSSTPRGARLARRLAGERLDAWGVAYGSEAYDALTLILAELCANAVCHGRVPGRDFRLGLTVARTADGVSIAVEVTDTRGEKLPEPALVGSPGPPDDADGGRGLVLVAALADDWGWYPRFDGPGKTVWATLHATSR